MTRGKQTLYNGFVDNSLEGIKGTKSKRNECLEIRRLKMACRYYFHAGIRRLRYDDAILNLHQEFDLMPDTVIKELQEVNDYINELKDNQTTTSELKRKYPYFNWTASLV